MKHLVLAASLLVAPVTGSASMLGPYSDLLVFGDSLSDAGRAFAELDPGFLPSASDYPTGQFTDGDTWATMLGAGTPVVNNFAFGGAKASTDLDPTRDFTAQRQDFDAARRDGLTLGPRTLTAVFFGGNDLRDAFGKPDAGAIGGQAIRDIITGTGELVLGFGLTDVLVFGLPNLGRTPEVRANGEAAAAGARQASLDFNNGLQAAVAELAANTGANIRYFDTFGAFEAIFANAEAQGINVNTPCLALLEIGGCGPADASGFAFYDTIHPTSVVHAAFAQAVTAELAPVPLPAGAMLLLTGMGGLGALVVARRRRTANAVTPAHEPRA